MRGKIKGSIAIEAAIVIPIVLLVVISILMAARVIYIRNNVEFALNQAAKEMAAYSSVYYAVYDDSGGQLNDNEKITKFLVEASVLDSGNSMVTEGALTAENELAKVTEFIVKSGAKGLKSDKGKIIAKYFFAKRLDSKIFDPLSIGAFVYKPLGGNFIDGMDFDESKILIDGNEIELLVKYKIELKLPLNFINEVNVRQRSCVRTCLAGESSGIDANLANLTVWNLPQLTRGKIISDNEQAKESYRTDILLEIRSIDVRTAYYQVQSNLIRELKTDMNAFAIVDSMGKAKIFRVIIPTGTMSYITEETLKVLEDYAKTKGMAFEIFARY